MADPAVDLAAIAAAFGHRLHAAGIPITPERSARFARAIVIADPADLGALYWLGRTTLLSAHDQTDVYDRLFTQFFRGEFRLGEFADSASNQQPIATAPGDAPNPGQSQPSSGTSQPHGTGASPSQRPAAEQAEQTPSVLAAMSTTERINDRDFSECSDEELELIRRLVEQLPLVPPTRQARRLRINRNGRRWDVRSTLRRSHRTGGDPVDLVLRRRNERPRRVVLIADVSGSMEPYARVYLHLMRGAVQALRAEAFVFATQLTRLTRPLTESHADVAYRRAAAAARDWSGGTRIGAALNDFINTFGRRGLARGAIIVIVSDGWEVDEPAGITQAMQRLSRLAHRVIWVNPRKAAPGYEPLVRGMAAALPYVDTFVSGHSVNALRDVMDAIGSPGPAATSTSTVGNRKHGPKVAA